MILAVSHCTYKCIRKEGISILIEITTRSIKYFISNDNVFVMAKTKTEM